MRTASTSIPRWIDLPLNPRCPRIHRSSYSLRSGQSTMVLSPGDDAVCRACPGRGDCTDMANFTGPVPEGGNVAVVAQIVAFTDDRRMELLMKAEKAS